MTKSKSILVTIAAAVLSASFLATPASAMTNMAMQKHQEVMMHKGKMMHHKRMMMHHKMMMQKSM